MTTAFEESGFGCAPPVDAASNEEFNLLNPAFMAAVVGILAARLIDLLHSAPPCASFSAILNGCATTRLRTAEAPGGIEGLNEEQQQQVRVGNALADVAAVVMEVQHKAGNLHQLEQPGRSLMVSYETMRTTLAATKAVGYQRDACVDGAPWRKPLVLYTNKAEVGRRVAAKWTKVFLSCELVSDLPV